MLFQKTLFSVCALFCVLTAMTHTTPLCAPNNQPTEAAAKTSPAKPASSKAEKKTKHFLTKKDKSGLKELLEDEKVKESLDADLKKKIQTIVDDPSGETLLTQKEAIALQKFMEEHGVNDHFTQSVKQSTGTLLKKSAAKIGGQWAIMFSVSLTAMVASGAIAAAAAAG